MDVEQARSLLLKMPHVAETMQWGANLVFWVGDKAIGGKMFTLINLDEDGRAVLCYCAGPERYAELLEREGVSPAPYLARAYWVAVERWSVFRSSEWQSELAAAHKLIYAKLPKRVRQTLALPKRELQELIRQQKDQPAKQAGQKSEPSD
jgi:predicted DNA-binding protein (MmcQ/YjbR family)